MSLRSYLFSLCASLPLAISSLGGCVLDADGEDGGELLGDVEQAARRPGTVTSKPIVFQSQRDRGCTPLLGCDASEDLYLIESDGSNLRRLTATPRVHEVMPAWSPDRSRIAFERFSEAGLELCYLTLDAALQPIETTCGPVQDHWYLDVAWRPDGEGLVYVLGGVIGYSWQVSIFTPAEMSPGEPLTGRSVDIAKDWRLAVIDLSGKELRVTKPLSGPVGPIFSAPAGWSNVNYVTWSPDGKRLAFSMQEDATGRSQLFTIRPDGSRLTQVTHGPGGNTAPSWSPDGRRIAFEAIDANDLTLTQLQTIAADGTAAAVVLPGVADNFDQFPAWN